MKRFKLADKTLNDYLDYVNTQNDLIIKLLNDNGMKFINTNITSFDNSLDAFGNIKKDLSSDEINNIIKTSIYILTLLGEFVSLAMIKRFYVYITDQSHTLTKEESKLYSKCVCASAEDFISRTAKFKKILFELNITKPEMNEFTYIENHFMNKFYENLNNMFNNIPVTSKHVRKLCSKSATELQNCEMKNMKFLFKVIKQTYKKISKISKNYQSMKDYFKLIDKTMFQQLAQKTVFEIKEKLSEAVNTLNGKEVTNLLFKFNTDKYIDEMTTVEETMLKSTSVLTGYILDKIITLIVVNKARSTMLKDLG